MKSVVELTGLDKRYGNVIALDDVSLSVGHGVTGLLGPNGAGKTTLIKALLGLVRASGGGGHVLGHDLLRDTRRIRQQVGFMPEDDCYIPGLTGVEMVQFAARLAGQPPIEGLRRAHEILDFSGVEQERYRAVDTYSTGMRQKIKFAQATVHDPPLMILDEPTAGLDPEERQSMLNRIRVLARQYDKAVLVSTHILRDVQSICDNVVILAAGRVKRVASLEELCRPASPAFHVRTLGDDSRLVARIEAAGVSVERQDDGSLRVISHDDSVAQRVWAWAGQSGVAIQSIAPAQNSLEKIFVDAVREEKSDAAS